jgi:hypothetical protein
MEERESDLEDDNDDHDSQLKCLVSPSIISGRACRDYSEGHMI